MADLNIRIAGSGGQGVILCSIILAEAALSMGKAAAQSQSYGPEARGGTCKAEVVISDGPIDFPKVEDSDLLLALTQDALEKYIRQARPGSVVMYDDSLYAPAGACCVGAATGSSQSVTCCKDAATGARGCCDDASTSAPHGAGCNTCVSGSSDDVCRDACATDTCDDASSDTAACRDACASATCSTSCKLIPVPILSVARDKLKKQMVANIVAASVINSYLKIVSPEVLEEVTLKNVPKGTEEINRAALHEGAKVTF